MAVEEARGRSVAELSTWDAPSTVAGDPRRVGEEAPIGARVGRYVLLGRLGSGGMGVVYDAFDPELGRRIALKILHLEASTSEARTRLLREAQSLARLSHPNVVTIFDAGTVDGRVWLAMELVEGVTLGAWLGAAPRPWPRVLEVMSAAGRGLQAAHAAGLVHRDFKPENVMIAGDGRVLVMDFGLAKPERALDSAPPLAGEGAGLTASLATSTPSFDALATPLTRADAIVGTPAYMPPEQLLGQPVDARADVFAFSVTLWEALCGERPFGGETLSALTMNVIQNQVRPPPSGRRSPAWLRELLRRGFHPVADRRFASIAELLAAIEAGQRRRRQGRLAAAGAALLCGVGALAGGVHLDERGREAACVAEGAAIDATWDARARARVEVALIDAGASHGRASAERVLPTLDAWAERWRDERAAVCRHVAIEGRWSSELRAQADECLDERRARFAALVEALARADALAARWAINAAIRLPAVEPCGESTYLAERPRLPEGSDAEVAALRATASRSAALELTGHYDEALAEARRGLAAAEALGWQPLAAELRFIESRLLERTGDLEPAERAAAAAYSDAGLVGADEVAAEAAILQVRIDTRLARHGEARVWARAARVALAALGEREGLRRAALLSHEASLEGALGDYAAAGALHRESLELRERLLGADHPEVAASLNNLANVEQPLGHFNAARELLERARAIEERALGPEHPALLVTLNNLGLVLFELGDVAEARVAYERALAIGERSLGPEHPELGATLNNLATAVWASDAAAARVLLERALAIEERAFGPEHPEVAASLANLAALCVGLEDLESAARLFERARRIMDASVGAEHPDAAIPRIGLADVAAARGDFEAALAGFEEASRVLEAALGEDHPSVGALLVRIADAERELGRDAEAIAAGERALALARGGEAGGHDEAVAAFALARALAAQPERRAEGRALAADARQRFVDRGEEGYVAEIDAWLAADDGAVDRERPSAPKGQGD